jgi:hypothetical protein
MFVYDSLDYNVFFVHSLFVLLYGRHTFRLSYCFFCVSRESHYPKSCRALRLVVHFPSGCVAKINTL